MEKHKGPESQVIPQLSLEQLLLNLGQPQALLQSPLHAEIQPVEQPFNPTLLETLTLEQHRVIFAAMMRNDVEFLKSELKADSENIGNNRLMVLDNNNKSVLDWAIEFGHLPFVSLLYQIGVSLTYSDRDIQPIMLAAKFGQDHIVKFLIDHGVCVDGYPLPINCHQQVVGKFRTPLHFAVSHQQLSTVELLRKNKANANVRDPEGYTALHLACKMIDAGWVLDSFIRALITDNNAIACIADTKTTPIRQIISRAEADKKRGDLESEYENSVISIINHKGIQRELTDAKTFDDLYKFIQSLLDSAGRGVLPEAYEATDQNGETLLGKIIRTAFDDDDDDVLICIQELDLADFLKGGRCTCDTHLDDKHNMFLHYAALYGSGSRESLALLKLFYDPDYILFEIFEPNKLGESPFQLVCRLDNTYILIAFLPEDAYETLHLDKKDIDDLTFYELMNQRYCHFANKKLSLGGDFEAEQKKPKTPMDLAIQHGNIDTVKLLVAADYPLHLTNSEGKTPLEVARNTGNKKIIQFIEKSTYIDKVMRGGALKDHDDLFYALSDDKLIEGFLFLIQEYGSLRYFKEDDGEAGVDFLRDNMQVLPSLLLSGQFKRREVLLKILMRTGTQVLKEYEDSSGNTLLHQCVITQNRDALSFLLRVYPAEVHPEFPEDNKKFGLGDLWSLGINGQSSIVDLLSKRQEFKKYCADFLNIKNQEGQTAINLAVQKNNIEMVFMLFAAGAEVDDIKTLNSLNNPDIQAKLHAAKTLEEGDTPYFIDMLEEVYPQKNDIVKSYLRQLNYHSYSFPFEREFIHRHFSYLFDPKNPNLDTVEQCYENLNLVLCLLLETVNKAVDQEEYFKLFVTSALSIKALQSQVLRTKQPVFSIDNYDDTSLDVSKESREGLEAFERQLDAAIHRAKSARLRICNWVLQQVRRDPSHPFYLAPNDIVKKIANLSVGINANNENYDLTVRPFAKE